MPRGAADRGNPPKPAQPATPTTPAKPTKPAKSGRLGRWLPVVGLIVGLLVIAYYPATEAIDSLRRAQIASQIDAVAQTADTSTLDEMFAQAEAYNRNLVGLTASIAASSIWPYSQQLSIDGHDTAFGYVIIPKISLTMPVYHGTSDAALSAGAGHLETSSLPVGGESTHTVITAHSGMSGMRAFDDIRQLEVGDVFGIKVYGRLVCYRVSSIETVLPEETESLAIQAGEDLATLVTCTPYGVNDHRLLVHAERCEVPDGFEENISPVASVVGSSRMVPFIVAFAVVAAVAVVLAIRMAGARRRKAKACSKKGRTS